MVSTGPEAQQLMQQLQLDKDSSHISLSDFCRAHPHFSLGSGYASVLSTHSHAMGSSTVSTLLVQHTGPEVHLTAQKVCCHPSEA